MDILDNWNITSKAGSIGLAKNTTYKLRKFWWCLEKVNLFPATVSNLHENKVSWLHINFDCFNSNYTISSERLAQNKLISTKNLRKTSFSKISVHSDPSSNSNSSLNDQQNLGSNLHRLRIENPSRIIFRQISINSIRNKFDLLMNIIKNETGIFMIAETKIG